MKRNGSMSSGQLECDCSSAPNVNMAPATAAAAAASGGPETSRSLVVDEAVFEEQFLRCPVCHERYNQNELAPKSLPCNHTFCLPCLTQIYDHSLQPLRRSTLRMDEAMEGTLKCPTCRVEIFLNRKKIKELPNDHRVIQMMDFLAQAVSKSQQVCMKHDRQPVNFFCKKCLVPVCRDCTVLDHKEVDGHAIADISEAMRENSTEFTGVENRSKEILEKLKRRSDALANASKRLDILDRQIKREIKDAFIEYRLHLEKRQEYLTSMVTHMIKEQKNKINSRFVSVCESGAQLQKLYDDFKACRENNDIRKIFPVAQQIKDGEGVFSEMANLDDNELFHSCEFDSQGEGCFLADLSGLGEIKSKVDPSLKETISAQQLLLLEMEEQTERERLRQMVEYDQEAQVQFRNILLRNDDRHELHRHQTLSQEGTSDSDEEQEHSFNSDSWPSTSMVSHLFGQLRQDSITFGDSSHEDADESNTTRMSNVRPIHRRGRRARDTNSSQVASSISPSTDISRLLQGQSVRSTQGNSRGRITAPQSQSPYHIRQALDAFNRLQINSRDHSS
uniref:RING-type domain-containing protein n=1 Tax=Biomphalaria glabrata TaxID=6526 RepID=A0A2C9L229_BIOGL